MRKGFSLAEVLVASILLAILSASFLLVVRIAYRLWYRAIPLAQSANYVRGGIDDIIRELKTADDLMYPPHSYTGVATAIVYLSSGTYYAIYRNTELDIATYLYKKRLGNTFTLDFDSIATPAFILMENVSSFSVHPVGKKSLYIIATFTYYGDETHATITFNVPFFANIRRFQE